MPLIEATLLISKKKKDIKSRRIILDGVKDHVIPHLFGNTTSKDMWEVMNKIFIVITTIGKLC